MKIIHLPSSEAYQLHPQAQLSVERPNPFFHDYAEQTVPLDIPASPHNCRLLGNPELLASQGKAQAITASIHDGEYHAQCRQYVLSAKRKGNISTSFYINDGSLYSRLQDTRLKDIFKDDELTFAGDTLSDKVQHAIDECEKIRHGVSNYCDRLALFPVLVTDDSGETDTTNYIRYKAINLPDKNSSTNALQGAKSRTEKVDGQTVSLAPGYYISPFIKTAYVLQRVFQHFGYTLAPSLLTHTAPFTDMVLLNNVIDTIVNGSIRLVDLVPDVTVLELLTLFRKKFRCEFSSDEVTRTVSIVFLRDIASASPSADLTQCLTEEPTIQYKAPKEYKRVVLKAKESTPSDPDNTYISQAVEQGEYEDIAALLDANPGAFFNPVTGHFYKAAVFAGTTMMYVKVADSSMPYDTGEDIEKDETEIPEMIPSMRSIHGTLKEMQYVGQNIFGGSATYYQFHYHPYVGDYATLHSKIRTGADSADGGDSLDTADNKMPAMLCFSYLIDGRSQGTVTPYDPNTEQRLSDYALHYHGEDGIFERFHREYDTMERNTLQGVKMRLLLPQHLKQTLPATAKVTVRGTALLMDKLKFTLGGKDAPMECELRSLALRSVCCGNATTNGTDGTSEARTLEQMVPRLADWPYKWVTHGDTVIVTEEQYNASPYKDATIPAMYYPERPTAAMVGSRQHELTICVLDRGEYKQTTYWLEAQAK